jgi:hypothetical protein
VHSDDERAARPQRAREAVTDVGLQALGEVGEDDVPAEDEVERARRRGRAEVLPPKLDRLLVGRAQAAVVECLRPYRRRQAAEAALEVAGAARPVEQRGVDCKAYPRR